MTKVTRQRKATVASQVAALPDTATADKPTAAASRAAGAEAPAPAKDVKQQGKKPEAKPAKPTKPAEEPKPKAKLVRDSFTMPKAEYELLAVLKQRGTQLHRHVKKSELLRAGIAALHSMSDKNFLLALDRAPSLKTGRPKAGASTDHSAADDSAAG